MKILYNMLVCVFFMLNHAIAQDRALNVSALCGSYFSNDGINAYVTPELAFKRNYIFIGPTFSLTSAVSYKDAYRGIKGGYKREVLSNDRWLMQAGLSYERYILNAPVMELNHGQKNVHHEVNLIYGIEWKALNQLHIGSGMGMGMFTEVGNDNYTYKILGYSRYFDLYLKYIFIK